MAFKHIQIFVIVTLVSANCFSISLSRPLDDELIMQKRHEEWMAQHGRVYADVKEKNHRYVVFKRNVEFIERFNSISNSERTFTLGVNQFTDLTNEEFRAMYTGYKRDSMLSNKSGRKSTPFKYQNLSCEALPVSIDWRKKGAVTPIKNQQSCRACWAFSAVAAIEGVTKIKKGKLVSLSEQELVDCDKYDFRCAGGDMVKAFGYVAEKGLTTESNYPYKAKNMTCNSKKTKLIAASISGYEYVPANNEKALMKAVAHQPVSIAIGAGNRYFRFYESGVLTGECTTRLDHGVVVVGYGESKNGLKYWIIKNSWGSDWGKKGYVRIQKDIKDKRGQCGLAMDASYPTI